MAEEQLELSKFFQQSEIATMRRSEIKPSDYNPRRIDDEGKRMLKRSLKLYGVLGGIIVNKQTGYTIVGGHQKVAVLDEINKYDEESKVNDYTLRVEVIDVEPKVEKQINITLNNPNVGGTWNYDSLRKLIPDIDYKDAGLTESDLSMIGVDYLFKSEGEGGIATDLRDMMKPADEAHRLDVEERQRQREAIRAAQEEANAQQSEFGNDEMEGNDGEEHTTPSERTREERIQHMKDVKAQVREQAIQRAQDNEAYIMLSFDNFENKQEFCEKFGINPYEKFFKGEAFEQVIDNALDDSLEG